MKRFKYHSVIYLLVTSFVVFGQGEKNNWYFGNYAGISFNTNPPSSITNGSLSTWEGCSSASDAAGNIIFYTDGITVYDRTNSVMANGTGLQANTSTSEAALIAKQSGNTNIYYVFSLNTNGSLYYSIVDMSLASGNGSVTTKNVLINSYCTEGLAGVKHCNGNDIWITTRNRGGSAYYSYLLTATGLNMTAVTSGSTGVPALNSFGTYLKFSQDGRKLGSAAPAIVYDFDPATGVVSNSVDLNGDGYGCEFSPDGSKFYVTLPGGLTQWDLCGSSNIAATAYTVPASPFNWAAVQLGPDGKIYFAEFNTSNLDVINNPNAAGSAMNYNFSGVTVSSGTVFFGLPNFVAGYPKSVVPPFTYTASNAYGCISAAFSADVSLTPYPSPACTSSGYSITSVLWNFGDPGSGVANSSTLLNPVHAFSNHGIYNVELILYYSCGGGTDTLKQNVTINQACISVIPQGISCTGLGSATANVTYGIGPFSYTWMPTGQTSSVATGLAPGSYTVTVYDTGSGITSTVGTYLNPLVSFNGTLNTTSVTCYSGATGTASFSALTGGSSAQNYLWTNGTNTQTTALANGLTAGLYSVTVTDVLTGCIISNTFFISQAPAFNLLLSASTPSVCLGGSIVLSGTNSGGTPYLSGAPYSYTWTAGPNTITHVVSKSLPGTYVYTLSSQDSLNCLISNTIAIDFVPPPLLSISNASVCISQTGTLHVSGATSYTWNNNPAYTGSSFSDNPTSNHQYTVLGSALGCTSTATASMIVQALPVALFTSNSPICNGSNLTLNAYGGSAYAWSGPNNFNSSLQSPTISAANLSNAGVYTLTVTSANSCTSSTTQTLVINPTPTLSATGSTVCNTQTLNLSVNATPGSSFLWHGPMSFSSALQNPMIVNPLLIQSGNYSVSVTSAAGCSNSAVAKASVVVPPSLTVSLSGNGTLCAQALNGSPNSITLTSSGANTYTLLTPNHIQNPNPSGPSSPLISAPPYNCGAATATLMGSNGVCVSSITVNLSIIPNPTISISSSTPVMCAGQSYTYTSQGASSYTWGPGSPNLSTYTGPVTVASPTSTSVFSVVGGSLGCNSGTQTSTITVNPLPVISITPQKAAICLKDQITLSAVGNATSYNWSPYTGLNATNGFSVNAGPLTEQTYTVIGSLNSCTNSAMITVSVLPLPKPNAVIENTAVCQNDPVFLKGSGGVSYYWQGPENISFAVQTASFTAYSPALSGAYILTVKDSNNCSGSSFVNLNVYGSPNGTLLKDNLQGCVPFSSNFRFRPEAASIKTQWNLDRKSFSTNTFSFTLTIAGEHKITGYLQDTLTHCANTQTFLVKAYPLPVADFSYAPLSPVENQDEVIFTNTSTGEQLEKWNWYFISNNGYASSHKNTSYLFADAGTYPVALEVTNAWGCSDTIVRSIAVAQDLVIYVPNAFTPNGDDLNEIFMPVLRNSSWYQLEIFDRWGGKLFESRDIATGWTGRYAGQDCKEDIYVWKISFTTPDGARKILNGTVLLQR